MKYKSFFYLVAIIILIFYIFYLIKSFFSGINFNINLYYEDHSVQKGESSLYRYDNNNYCFSGIEKQMISDRLKLIDVFNNEIFKISSCGDLSISFAVKDYDSYGYIILYSYTSFQDLKDWFISQKFNNKKIDLYDTWISIKDEYGDILFFENKDNSTFRIIYITKLPYRYKINEINSFPPFIQYFLEVNQKNITQKIV